MEGENWQSQLQQRQAGRSTKQKLENAGPRIKSHPLH